MGTFVWQNLILLAVLPLERSEGAKQQEEINFAKQLSLKSVYDGMETMGERLGDMASS